MKVTEQRPYSWPSHRAISHSRVLALFISDSCRRSRGRDGRLGVVEVKGGRKRGVVVVRVLAIGGWGMLVVGMSRRRVVIGSTMGDGVSRVVWGKSVHRGRRGTRNWARGGRRGMRIEFIGRGKDVSVVRAGVDCWGKVERWWVMLWCSRGGGVGRVGIGRSCNTMTHDRRRRMLMMMRW
jgi:hypothetical protein